jgi:hypothetical protein
MGLALVVAAVLAIGCEKAGDPVRATLDRIVKAAHDRDAPAVMSLLTSDFQAADGSARAETEELLRRTFAAYSILNVTLRDVQVERAENAARVRFRAEMSGQPLKIGGLGGLLPSSASYDFDLRMAPDGKAWKVAWAQWTPAS